MRRLPTDTLPALLHQQQFDRLAAVAAWLVGLCSILYAIVYLGLVPGDQRSSNASEFFSSYLEDGAGALHTSWVLLALAGLLSTPVIGAIYGRLRADDPAVAGLAAGVGMLGALLSMVHAVAEIAGNAELAAIWRDGDTATRAALTVSNSLPAGADPRGLATFGFAGLFWLASGWIIIRGGTQLPSRLGRLALAGGVLLIVLFFGTAFESDPLILIPGALVSLVIGPTWWFWLGRIFWRTGAAVPLPAAMAEPAHA